MSRSRVGASAATVLLVAAALVAAALLLRPAAEPTFAEQAEAIAAELRCPDCAGLSAADSPTRAAAEIRRQVEEMLADGQGAEQIKAAFVARYGNWILLTPPGPAAWVIPLAATAIGGGVLGWWLLGRRPSPGSAQPATPMGGPPDASDGAEAAPSPVARRVAAAVAVGLAVAVGIGYLLPEPFSLAAETVVNQPLAEAIAAEAERQADIERLLAALAADPNDPDTLSELADAYLAGSSADDLQRAALTLLALIGLQPEEADHYTRLISAYIRADDWTDAEAATDALAELAPSSPDVPFFRGLIAWQGAGDAEAAIAAFDEFLAEAPDDPRVPMVRALRQEAAAGE